MRLNCIKDDEIPILIEGNKEENEQEGNLSRPKKKNEESRRNSFDDR